MAEYPITLNNILEQCKFLFKSSGTEGIILVSFDLKYALKLNIIEAIPERYDVCGKDFCSRHQLDFEKEVKLQNRAYWETAEDPICPRIFDANNDFARFTYKIKFVGEKNKEFQRMIEIVTQNCKSGYATQLGIIAMEYIRDCQPMQDFVGKKDREGYRVALCAYVVIRLLVMTGINHADFTPSNILLREEEEQKEYFNGVAGKPTILDFGYAVELDDTETKFVKEKFKEKDYSAIMKHLYSCSKSDGCVLSDYEHLYGYVCGEYDIQKQELRRYFTDDFNKKIDQLFKIQPILDKKHTFYCPTPLYKHGLTRKPASVNDILEFHPDLKRETFIEYLELLFDLFDDFSNDLTAFAEVCQRYMYILKMFRKLDTRTIYHLGFVALQSANVFRRSQYSEFQILKKIHGVEEEEKNPNFNDDLHKIWTFHYGYGRCLLNARFTPVLVLPENIQKKDLIDFIVS